MKSISLALIIISFIFQSCKEEENTYENLNKKLLKIEKNVIHGRLKISNFNDPYEQIHMDFFMNLANLNQINDQITYEEKFNQIVSLNNQNLLKSGIFFENENRILTETETLLLNSYIKSLKSNDSISNIEITEYYINQIQNLDNISEESKNFIIYAIGFYRSLLTFVNFDKIEEDNNEKSALKKDWMPCNNRDCFDCCMFRWTQSMEDWNLVDWVEFLASPAVNTAWRAGSCGYACVF